MASTANAQYMVTKNAKLEATLARCMVKNPNDQLIGYDACIEKTSFGGSFRVIVLGLESIYLADNPPKSIQLKSPRVLYRNVLHAEIVR